MKEEEYNYLKKKGYDTNKFKIIRWPESKKSINKKEIDIPNQLINDVEGLELFGAAAFIVKK